MNVIFWNDMPNPPSNFAARTMGVYKIAGYIRNNGYTAQVIDFVTSWTKEELLELTEKFITKDTMVLGIGMTHIYHAHHIGGKFVPDNLFFVLTELKNKYPSLRIILGGHLGNKFKGSPLVDCVVTGFAEDTFLELLNHFKNDDPPPQSRKVMLPSGNAMMLNYHAPNQQRYQIDGDSFKFADQDAIFPGETLPIEVSRGCIFKCKFCQFDLLGKKKLDYLRSMECVKEEIIHNYENYGVSSYYVVCDTFNDTEYKIKSWHDMLATLPFKVDYTAYIRADLLHAFPDTPHMLKESGLVGAMHGIESLHPKASLLVGKAWSGKHAREWIPTLYHEIWNKEVTQHLNFIIGLPYDTKESINDTVKWYNENDLHSIKFTALGFFSSALAWTVTSEFDKNSDKYGFKTDAKGGWYNQEWTVLQANEFAKEIEEQLKYKAKLHPWTFMHLKSLGYDKDHLLSITRKEFNWPEAIGKNKAFLSAYYNKLKSL
jgi:radical SAM superfamily enzyme YgiQ (UPF0313 family)